MLITALICVTREMLPNHKKIKIFVTGFEPGTPEENESLYPRCPPQVLLQTILSWVILKLKSKNVWSKMAETFKAFSIWVKDSSLKNFQPNNRNIFFGESC